MDVDELGPFEVTQLVNSFLGALVHPWEVLFKNREIENCPEMTKLSQHLASAWTNSVTPLSLNEHLGCLRNAFAHGHIEFLCEALFDERCRDIGGMRLWNCKTQGSVVEKTWEIRLETDGLRALLMDFSHAADLLYDPALARRVNDCTFAKSQATS